MEMDQAIQMLRALASGLDPESSRPVEPGSILLRPEVVRTLNLALNTVVRRQEREKNRPTNAGHYWSHEEDEQVCKAGKLPL